MYFPHNIMPLVLVILMVINNNNLLLNNNRKDYISEIKEKYTDRK